MLESVGACAAKYVWRRAREPLAVFGLHVLLGVLYRLVFGCVFLKAAAGARRRGVRDEVSESLVVTRVVERRETRRTREATLKRGSRDSREARGPNTTARKFCLDPFVAAECSLSSCSPRPRCGGVGDSVCGPPSASRPGCLFRHNRRPRHACAPQAKAISLT